MVQIKIKGLNDGVHVYGVFDQEQQFLEELKERLKAFSCQKKAVEAFFHLSALSDRALIAFFQLCEQAHVLIKGMDPINKREVEVHQGVLHNGQQLSLTKDTIWIGDLHSGSHLLCEGSLFVIGKVEGVLDLKYEDNILAASSIQANVRICDTSFHNVTSFSPVKVYYKHRTVAFENVKEELYGRSDRDYVW